MKRLSDMGLPVEVPPTSTFYIWLNLEALPAPINNGLVRAFFITSIWTVENHYWYDTLFADVLRGIAEREDDCHSRHILWYQSLSSSQLVQLTLPSLRSSLLRAAIGGPRQRFVLLVWLVSLLKIDCCSGLDAMERIIQKAKESDGKVLGKNYKVGIDEEVKAGVEKLV